jgi:hypothetical protein
MTAYIFLNWVLCLTTSVLLVMLFLRHRYMFIKPSIMVIVFFHLRIQWTATVEALYIESFLPDPWVFLLLTQGFPLLGLLGSLGIGNRAARAVWRRILEPRPVSPRVRRKTIVLLGSYVALFLPIYFQYIPFSSTGLYTIIADPAGSALARESSLKLVDNALVRYGYSFMISVFAPLLSVPLADALLQNLKRRRFLRGLVALALLGSLLVAVSLTGARANAAKIILIILFAAFLRRGLRFNPIYVGLAILVVLTLPTVLTILRQGLTVNWLLFWRYLDRAVLYRLFGITMDVGLWHVHYAQTVGFVGVQGHPRLAALFGMEPVNVSNLVGLAYSENPLPTVLANTSYVYAYYAYFGLVSFFFSLPGLWLLDAVLWVYRRIGDNLLLPCVASVSMISSVFIGTEYTIALLTNGFAIVPVVALVLDRLCRIRIVLGPKQATGMAAASLIAEKVPKGM